MAELPKPLEDAIVEAAVGVVDGVLIHEAIRSVAETAYVLGLRDGRREGQGAIKSDAKYKRKVARLTDELGNHVDKAASLRHEISKLEDLLAWAVRTDRPIEEIKRTITQTIPRRIARGE